MFMEWLCTPELWIFYAMGYAMYKYDIKCRLSLWSLDHRCIKYISQGHRHIHKTSSSMGAYKRNILGIMVFPLDEKLRLLVRSFLAWLSILQRFCSIHTIRAQKMLRCLENPRRGLATPPPPTTADAAEVPYAASTKAFASYRRTRNI